jgi:hypothetical protein
MVRWSTSKVSLRAGVRGYLGFLTPARLEDPKALLQQPAKRKRLSQMPDCPKAVGFSADSLHAALGDLWGVPSDQTPRPPIPALAGACLTGQGKAFFSSQHSLKKIRYRPIHHSYLRLLIQITYLSFQESLVKTYGGLQLRDSTVCKNARRIHLGQDARRSPSYIVLFRQAADIKYTENTSVLGHPRSHLKHHPNLKPKYTASAATQFLFRIHVRRLPSHRYSTCYPYKIPEIPVPRV